NHHVPDQTELENSAKGAVTGLLEGFTGLPGAPGDHTDEFEKQRRTWRTPGVLVRALVHLPAAPEPSPGLVPVGSPAVGPAVAAPAEAPFILMSKAAKGEGGGGGGSAGQARRQWKPTPAGTSRAMQSR